MSKKIIQPIRQDFLNGMSFTAIRKKYSIDSRTAKGYAINNLPLEELDKRPFFQFWILIKINFTVSSLTDLSFLKPYMIALLNAAVNVVTQL